VRRIVFSLALVLCAAVLAAPAARAMGIPPHPGSDKGFTSLEDLVAGESLTSGNGELVFSDFEVFVSGSLNGNLGYYRVVTLDDGFAITGPIAAADGNAGDLLVRYTVTSTSPITQAHLLFNGVASGKGSSASVVDTYDEPLDVELFVFSTGEGGKQRTDSLDLEGFTTLRVTKDILVDSKSPGDWVAISWIEQTFTSAPEPATLLLIGLALAAVSGARRRA